MAAKNLRILGTTVGPFQTGDVVPAYALTAADPANIVAHRLAEWTDDAATVEVPVESLVRSAPDASADLVKAHAGLLAKATRLEGTVDTLHARVVELEAKSDALAKENAAKVAELATVKADRDAARVEVETLKATLASVKEENATLDALLTEAEKAKPADPKPPTK